MLAVIFFFVIDVYGKKSWQRLGPKTGCNAIRSSSSSSSSSSSNVLFLFITSHQVNVCLHMLKRAPGAAAAPYHFSHHLSPRQLTTLTPFQIPLWHNNCFNWRKSCSKEGLLVKCNHRMIIKNIHRSIQEVMKCIFFFSMPLWVAEHSDQLG